MKTAIWNGMDAKIMFCPLHEQINCIEVEQIGLDNVSTGLKGSTPPREVGKKQSSSDVDSRNTHPSLY